MVDSNLPHIQNGSLGIVTKTPGMSKNSQRRNRFHSLDAIREGQFLLYERNSNSSVTHLSPRAFSERNFARRNFEERQAPMTIPSREGGQSEVNQLHTSTMNEDPVRLRRALPLSVERRFARTTSPSLVRS